MPALSLAELYDFETQFETATERILADSGIAAFVSQQRGTLPLIATGVSFDVGAAADELTFLPLAAGQQPPAHSEYFIYTGTLTLEVSVNRDTAREATDPGLRSFLGEARGRIRSTFLRSLTPFYDGNLPFYRVWDIRPTGTTTGFDQAKHVDTVILSFLLKWAIQPGAWPVGFPQS